MYQIGHGLVAGAFDEVHGKGRSGGLKKTTDQLLEQEVLSELGHQLGQGLTSGVAEVDPEQQARLEAVVDGLITVAARRAGRGLRNEVSPELREMVQKDIVDALNEGLQGKLGNTLEETVDRVVARAVSSLRDSLDDEDMQLAVSDLLRDSVYYAMREGDTTPAIGETLEATLTQHMLVPIDGTIDGISDVVKKVDDSAQRTENTLRGVIGALVVVSSVIGMLYFIRNRQVRRLQEQNSTAERGLRNLDAALEQLDADSRAAVIAKLQEYEAVVAREYNPVPPRAAAGGGAPRSDAYQRRS